MKKYIILVLVCLSCNIKSKKEEPCIKKMEYISQWKMLVPEDAIIVHLDDQEEFIQKKLSFKELKGVIVYGIKEKDRHYFRIGNSGEVLNRVEDNTIIFSITTYYFRPNVYIDGVMKENKWTPEQIQKAIEGDIGFVFEKDTIKVKMCKN